VRQSLQEFFVSRRNKFVIQQQLLVEPVVNASMVGKEKTVTRMSTNAWSLLIHAQALRDLAPFVSIMIHQYDINVDAGVAIRLCTQGIRIIHLMQGFQKVSDHPNASR
jgi:hypothetical protein